MSDYTINESNKENTGSSQSNVTRNRRIRELYESGSYSYRKLGRIYGISHKRIADIVKEGLR